MEKFVLCPENIVESVWIVSKLHSAKQRVFFFSCSQTKRRAGEYVPSWYSSYLDSLPNRLCYNMPEHVSVLEIVGIGSLNSVLPL